MPVPLGKFMYCVAERVVIEGLEYCGCNNCDGLHCTACRCREYHEECEWDCPECCISETKAKQMELPF